MLLRANVAGKDEAKSVFLVDTSVVFPLALEDSVWRKAGFDVAKLQAEPSLGPTIKSGVLPSVKLGGFDLPRIPAVQGAQMGEVKHSLDVDLDGVLGAGLLQAFRVTLGDGGRFMWLEPDPSMAGEDPRRSDRPMPPADPAPKAPPARPAAGAKK